MDPSAKVRGDVEVVRAGAPQADRGLGGVILSQPTTVRFRNPPHEGILGLVRGNWPHILSKAFAVAAHSDEYHCGGRKGASGTVAALEHSVTGVAKKMRLWAGPGVVRRFPQNRSCTQARASSPPLLVRDPARDLISDHLRDHSCERTILATPQMSCSSY